MAWLASYMMVRLARAFLSQGEAALSGWARMRLPSVSPIVLMMADDISTSPRVIMLIRSARSCGLRGRFAAADAVDQRRLADLNLIAGVASGASLTSVVVDEGAVGAADVHEVNSRRRPGETRRAGARPRCRAGESGWTDRGRCRRGFSQLELLAFVGAFDHQQTRHECSFPGVPGSILDRRATADREDWRSENKRVNSGPPTKMLTHLRPKANEYR